MNEHCMWLCNKNNAYKVAIILFGIALVIRLMALLFIPDAHISSNAKGILEGASLILNGQFINNPDYPMLVPPLSSLFIAAIQTVLGYNLFAIKLFQILLDACTVILIFYIGINTVGYLPAVLGAGLLTAYPFSVFVPLYIGTETLFTFFLALFVFTFIKGLKKDVASLFFISGLFLGLATLTRGTTLFLPFFMICYINWYYRHHTKPKYLVNTALYILGFSLILSPWIIRNYVVHNAFIPSSTSNGPLLHGSSEEFWLIGDRERELPRYLEYLLKEKRIDAPSSPKPSWVEKDHVYMRAAIEKYKDRWNSNPGSYLPFIAKKFARLWYATESGSKTALVISINLPFYLFGIIGFFAFIRKRNKLGNLLILLLIYFVVLHVLVFGYFRYMIPVMPYFILFASYGGLYLIRYQGKRLINISSS